MVKKDILVLGSRHKIYNFISENPGSHLRDISRKLNIPKSTLSYHLRFLEKRELIELKNENNRFRYFIAKKYGRFDKKILDLFQEDVPRTIILLLLLYEGYT
jgi:predicted transcriptional regulator